MNKRIRIVASCRQTILESRSIALSPGGIRQLIRFRAHSGGGANQSFVLQPTDGETRRGAARHIG